MSLNKLLLQRRQELGLTQQDVTKKLGFKNAQLISNIERNKQSLSAKHYKKLSKLLDIPLLTMVEARVNDYRQTLIKKLVKAGK